MVEAQKFIGFSSGEPPFMGQDMQPRPFVPMYGQEGINVHGSTLASVPAPGA
ncbi:hypothetical protein GCM10010523_19050 [Paenarthrobacter ilicis]